MRPKIIAAASMALTAIFSVTACDIGAVRRPPGAASGAPVAPPGAAPVDGPEACESELAESSEGLLKVDQIWPSSTSKSHGYRSVQLNRHACSQQAAAGEPQCERPFPWIARNPTHASAILAEGGAEILHFGTIRGHQPVPDGEVAIIQELRQIIASGQALDPTTNAVVQAAQVCASPIQENENLIFRSKAPGQEIDGMVAAFLVVAENKLIWLEFDNNSGWTEEDYRKVVGMAVAEAAKI